jgi:hypothetical protein
MEDNSQVQLLWDVPATNADKVIAYSMFVRRDLGMNPLRTSCAQHTRTDSDDAWTRIDNVTSPHWLRSLQSNSLYMIYLITHTVSGDSLPSDIVEYRTPTLEATTALCPFGGAPLRTSGQMVFCRRDVHNSCPLAYQCVQPDERQPSYCCPGRVQITGVWPDL